MLAFIVVKGAVDVDEVGVPELALRAGLQGVEVAHRSSIDIHVLGQFQIRPRAMPQWTWLNAYTLAPLGSDVAGEMHTDPLFYRLFQERPEFAGLSAPGASAYRLLHHEAKQASLRLDGVPLPRKGRDAATSVFVEAQFQGCRTSYGHWFAAISLYPYRHRITRPWRALVPYPGLGADSRARSKPTWATRRCRGSEG